jgi:hypothetical protein
MVVVDSSILSGVPTDSQLVLHLLREHERQLSPLPPPPPAPSVNEKKEQLQEHAIDTPVDDPTTSTVSSDAEEEEEEEEGSPKKEGVRMRAFKAGGKKMVAGMQKVMGKVATVGADVSVEGSRQKVRTPSPSPFSLSSYSYTSRCVNRSDRSSIVSSTKLVRKTMNLPPVRPPPPPSHPH